MVSRGGLPVRSFAEYLGLPFVDAADVMLFHHDSLIWSALASRLKRSCCRSGSFVLPGFYGASR